jgi:3-(3-hydroxy-phenyl)propionate hydroxylase
MSYYTPKPFPYRTPAELLGGPEILHPVIIVGAGPVGLAAAIDLAVHGVRSIVLDDNNVVSVGSRAICWSKRTLEIFDRLGVGERMVEKGVTWQIGRVFHRDQELYSLNLLTEGGHKMPAFINLQQYYVEEYLAERAREFADQIDIRWKHKFRGLQQRDDAVLVEVDTPDGCYTLQAGWLVAADGARSTVRGALGLAFDGQVFEEKFLIADIRMKADYPSDRRFWFQPTFDPGESVLIHRQPDSMFRIDFQLGWDADAAVEGQTARVAERVRRVVGADTEFELDWCSVYTFRCARLERFVHSRVLFAGDSAHVVSPFGARGGNGGIQDIDNLCWKLALVLKHEAAQSILESYNLERVHACEENIRHSSRTTRFMTPKTQAERQLRDAVLALAQEFPFARSLVNSGRLSRPCSLAGLSSTAVDTGTVAGPMAPGTPCADAPILRQDRRRAWLLEFLGGEFTIMTFATCSRERLRLEADLRAAGIDLSLRVIVPMAGADPIEAEEDAVRAGRVGNSLQLLLDVEGLACERYGGEDGVTYLIRPDQHVAARFRSFDVTAVARALTKHSRWQR